MNRLIRRAFAVCSMLAATSAASTTNPGPAGDVAYPELSRIHAALRELQEPEQANGLPDHSRAAIARKQAGLATIQARLDALPARTWSRSRQVDYLVVRGAADGYAFELQVSRPWARDPGFYIDPLLQLAFTTLPAADADLPIVRAGIERVPALLKAARRDLDGMAAAYAQLAIRNLETADGVGHGHPYRATPPAGVLGWYADLADRARESQPELAPTVAAARAAVADFRDWLKVQLPQLDAPAGAGRRHLDWYLRHVSRLPWTSDQLLVLGEREYARLRGDLALERQRNRALPELAPAASREDYERRIADADRDIRRFLVERAVLTIPGDIGHLDSNVPWIVRPGGRNFWEQIQYRDPRPDHVHAVIPGHRFDLLLASRSTHPIRAHARDGTRIEGWAYYVEDALLQLGLLEQRPRTRELFHIFGIKRAVRVHADVMMQRNRMSVDEATSYMVERVPYLDADVARVDAEIYLRRPPGYGLGYLIGKLQVDALLADQSRLMGERFDLKAFHDAFLGAGLIPVSLIRWEMTGLDDEAAQFWEREPL